MRRHVIVTVVVTLLLSALVTCCTGPATASGPVTVNATTMTVSPSNDGVVVTDTAATSGRALEVRPGGTASVSETVVALSQIEIRARATTCSGSAPTGTVRVDGQAIGTLAVSATTYTSYAVTAALSAGRHTLSIATSKPARFSCAGNLYLDTVTFVPAASSGTGTPPSSPCPANQYLAQYYAGTTLAGTPVVQQCEYAVGASYGTTAPVPGVAAGNFSVRYTGQITFPVSTTYTVAGDTGGTAVQASIDGTSVLSYPTASWGHYASAVSVAGGTHTVQVTIGVPTTSGFENFSISQTALGTQSANGNYFAQTSFWNQPIPSTATVDSRSAGWVSQVYGNSAITQMSVNSTAWTSPIYTAPAGTATTSIAVTNSNLHITIPYSTAYRPSPDSDSHLAVIDAATGCEYEFQGFNPSSLSAIAEATHHAWTGSGAHVSGPALGGGELSLIGGMITPRDVASGTITHALRYAMPPANTAPSFQYPGTRSDGTTLGGVPEGTWMRLNPTLSLAQFNLTPFQQMVAVALQTYGGYNADTSGAFSLYTESTVDGSTYSQPIAALPKSLIQYLQFLTPGPSTAFQMDTNTDTSCAQQQ
jgi:hypothetical protein